MAALVDPAPQPNDARRRAARFVLVAAAVGALLVLAPRVPAEQPLRLVFGPQAAPARVTLTWQDVAGGATGGATLWVPAGVDTLSHTLKVPDGQYVLEIDVETVPQRPDALRSPGSLSTHRHHAQLHGDTTTLYLTDRP